MNCVFCNLNDDKITFENKLAFAVMDKYPAGKGHMLFIPKRHYKNFFEATEEEVNALYRLLHKGREYVNEKYSPDGYNVVINVGEDAGQAIMHLHIHLIPRYKEDKKKHKKADKNRDRKEGDRY